MTTHDIRATDLERPFTAYVLNKAIRLASDEIDKINESLRLAAKKGTDWDEYHGMMIRQIFELRKAEELFKQAMDRLPDDAAEYLSQINDDASGVSDHG